MRSSGSIYWRAPLSMLGSFTAGILLALGHHFFYQSLSGSSVPAADHNILGLSKQRINTSAGTALAFLVKACFAFSMSVAYVQLVWKSIKSRRTKILQLNALFSILGNAVFLADYSLWLKYPLSLSTALSIWLIPIVAVIAPATLTVETVPVSSVFPNIAAPTVDYSGLDFAYTRVVKMFQVTGLDTFCVYEGPGYPVTKVVAATAAQGVILPFSASHPNSSWSVDFFGPAIRCHPVKTALKASILTQLNHVSSPPLAQAKNLIYLGWTPNNGDLPYAQDKKRALHTRGNTLGPTYYYSPGNYSSSQAPHQPSLSGIGESLSVAYPDSEIWDGTASDLKLPRLFVAAFPLRVNDPSIPYESLHASLISCALYNASYHTDFEFLDGAQTVSITVAESHNDVVALNTISWDSTSSINPYQPYYQNGSAIEVLNTSSGESNGQYNSSINRILAYQSVFDAFGKILVGSISLGISGTLNVVNTSIMSTVLFDTVELSGYRGVRDSVIELVPELVGAPLPLQARDPEHGHLQHALEELFQNITISLMTSDSFQPSSPLVTNVTQTSYHNIYVYAAPTLWLAYGLGIAVTSVGVIVGGMAMLSTKASYSTDFSTILRATRHAELSVEVHSLDVGGQDPLPRYLAKAILTFQRDNSSGYAGLQAEDLSHIRLGNTDKSSHAAPTAREDRRDTAEGLLPDTTETNSAHGGSNLRPFPKILRAPPLARYDDR